MTRYLDREPQIGDRVHVEFDTQIVAAPGAGTVKITHQAVTYWVDCSEVRVIAPEPKVGDVVTADMDLPEGTIIAHANGGVGVLGIAGRIFIAGMQRPRTDLDDLSDLPGWRIVRIGGAS